MGSKRKRFTAPAPPLKPSVLEELLVSRRVSFLVFLAALLVRFLYLWSVRETLVTDVLVLDSKFYHEWALQIVQRDWIGQGIFFMTPLYPYLLAVLHAVFGSSLYPALILQAFAGSGFCWLIFIVARRLFTPGPALLAGLWAACYGPMVFHEGVLMKECWILLANMGTLAILVREEDREFPRRSAMLAAGLLVGVSALLRPNIFLWLPLLAWWAWRCWRRKSVASILLLFFGAAVVVFPVSLRNRVVGGEWVLTVTSAGMNLWTGNNPEATGTYYGAPFVSSQVPENERDEFKQEASKRAGRELTLSESDRYWRAEAFRFVTGSPGMALRVMWRKWIYFWHSWEIPSNLNYYVAKDSSWVLRMLVFGFGWLGPISILGLLFHWRKLGGRLWLPLSLFLVHLATNMIFFTHSAYRLAAIGPLFLFAAGAFHVLFEAFRQSRHSTLALWAVLFAGGAYFCNRPIYRIEGLNKGMGYYTVGNNYERKGRYDEAERMYQKALQTNPNSTMVLKKMAELYQKMGLEDSARKVMARGLRSKKSAGAEVEAHERAASLFLEKRYAEAAEVFGRLIASDPDNAHSYHNNRGLAYLRMQQGKRAEADFRRALEIKSDYAPAHYNLGILFLKRGKGPEAIREFQETVRLDPGHVKARRRLNRLIPPKRKPIPPSK